MTVNYPTLAFAFNPITIEISDTIQITETVTLIVCGIELKREPINGIVSFDIQSIARSLFNRKEFYKVPETDNILYKELSFTVKLGLNEYNGEINIIWGALQIGETYTQSKTLTYFKNFPFTVPLYSSENKQVLMRYDNKKYENWKNLTTGKYNLKTGLPNANKKIVIRVDAGDAGGVFDYTFDHTFKKTSKNTIIIRLNVNECTNGIYIRWINKYGEYCYYLFSTGIESNEVKNADSNIVEFLSTVVFIGNYNPGTNHQRSKEGQKSVRLFAPLADKDTFKFLESIVESTVVDLFAGYNDNNEPIWFGVNIAPGTISRDKLPLQDFECNLILPKTFIQEL